MRRRQSTQQVEAVSYLTDYSSYEVVRHMSNQLSETLINQLKGKLRGRIIGPSDKDYDEARKVYNAMIVKKPRLIAKCVDVADVIECVNFARENNVLVSIRGGGHARGRCRVAMDRLRHDRRGPCCRRTPCRGTGVGGVAGERGDRKTVRGRLESR